MVASGAAKALAKISGRSADEAARVLKGIDDSTLINKLAEEKAFNPNAAFDTGAKQASKTPLYLGAGGGAAAAGVGAGFAAPSFAEGFESQQEKQQQAQALENIQYIMDNPNIPAEQKEDALRDAIDAGLLGDKDDGGGSGGVLGGLLGTDGNAAGQVFRGILLLIVVYFAAKALSNRMSNGGM